MKVDITEKENEDELVVNGRIFNPQNCKSKILCRGCYFYYENAYCEKTCTFENIDGVKCRDYNRRDKRNIVWKLKEEEDNNE